MKKLINRIFIRHLTVITFFVISASCSYNEKQSMQQAYPVVKGSGNWPSFRGEYAGGVLDEQNLPDEWDAESGKNIKWKTIIPGLAHSCPIVWEDKLIVTSAVSSIDTASFEHGLFGDGDASIDTSEHKWMIFCLDKKTGKIIWERTAHQGIPKDKRHTKATYNNSTPVTDGRYIVALFGSEGLYCYDMDGNFEWKRDIGRIDCGAYDAPELEWGPASSPIIYQDLIIVQVDTQKESFILACNIKSGQVVWKTERDELPSWGTPTIVTSKDYAALVTNSSNYIYGYDPFTGEELWRLDGSSKITAPTPVSCDSLIIVCSGRRPEAPIFAVRTGARGNISLQDEQTSNEFVAWSKVRRGPYMPTPLIYRGFVYVLNNYGNFDCYELTTGKEIYRQMIDHKGGGFTASPAAADGRIFCPSEDGEIFVVKSGPEFKVIAKNNLGERLMASPAISDSMIYFRAERHLFVVGQ